MDVILGTQKAQRGPGGCHHSSGERPVSFRDTTPFHPSLCQHPHILNPRWRKEQGLDLGHVYTPLI